MFKRVALVLVSLLMLNSCAELFELMGGEIIVEGYSPWSYEIDSYDVGMDEFTLSWSETTYNDGSNGSFYYELYVVEGYEYNTNNFYYNNMVTSGWGITSYTVTGLDPNTTYSYVVAVSDSEFGAQIYYNIGNVTTQSYFSETTFTPSDYDIYAYDIDTNSFSLSWYETTYNNGSYGSFYYELYLVEGYETNEYNFYSNNLVASGWDLTSFYLSGLNSNTTYSYVVAVSDSEYGSKVYYNVSSITTNMVYSADYIGIWEMTEDGYTSMVLTFNSDSFNFDMYNMYGEYDGSVAGSLTEISTDTVSLNFQTMTDADGYTSSYYDQDTFSWYVAYGNLYVTADGETMTFYPYDGINLKYDVMPTRVYLTPSYSWYDDSLSSNEIVHYHYSVTPGAQYTIAWNDSHQGNGTKGLDIKVSAWDTEGFYYLSGEDSGYNYPHTITIPDGVYDLTVEVEAWYSGSTGTYAIQVTQVY